MGLCSKRFGYESPAVGTWCLALSLQLVTGIIMILVGYDKSDIHSLLDASDLTSNSYKVFTWMGVFHVGLAAIIAVVVALGLFVSPCFLCPLCIISVVEGIYCVVTSATSAAYLQPYISYVKHTELLLEGSNSWSAGDTYFARSNSGYILAAAALSLATIAAFSRANAMDNDTPIPEAQLYVPCVALVIISGVIFSVGGGGEGFTVALGTIWFVVAVALVIILNLAGCCCTPKIFNVIVSAAFVCAVVYGLISCIVAGATYRRVVNDVGIPGDPAYFKTPGEDVLDDYKVFMIMGGGKWLVVGSCTSLAVAVLGAFAAAYALRSVLSCCGKGE